MAKNNLVVGTLILALASFITRIFGFVFRIYMSNVMGAEALGLYQLIFPIFILAWTISGAGISVAVSQLVARETGKRHGGNALRIARVAVVLSTVIGCLISVILYVFADTIAISIIHEPRTVLSLRILSSCIPFMAASSSIKGYFYGKQEMGKPALSQIIEQVIRMITIFVFSSFFISKGLEYACALGILGLSVGEIASFFYAYVVYKKDIRQTPISLASISRYKAFMVLSSFALPLTLNRVVTSLLQSAENILIPIKLQEFGLTNHQALSVYGQFTGMTMPLIFFPSLITASLATALIPAVSHAKASRNQNQLQFTVSKTIQFTLLIGIGATALFMSLAHEISVVVYNQPAVGNMLYALSFICPFFYLESTLLGILNGLGRQFETVVSSIIGSVICITIIYFVVPYKGLLGFIAGLIISSTFITILHLTNVLKYTSITIDVVNWFLKPALAAAAGALTIKYILHHYLINIFSYLASTLIAIAALGVFYILLVFLLGSLTLDDIRIFKKGGR